jgi:trehalose-6-phosphatase
MIPQDKIIDDLETISHDTRNIVCILSNQSKQEIEKTFKRCPRLWLAAEGGFHYRCNSSSGNDWK